MRTCTRVLSSLSLALACGASLAQSWNPANEFTTTSHSNPNGVWSYGYDPAVAPGYQFKAFDQYEATDQWLFWLDSGYNINNWHVPTVWKNLNAPAEYGVDVGQIILHPGPTAFGDAAILRFTAPATSAYDFVGQALAGRGGFSGNDTTVWLVKNNDFAAPLVTLSSTNLNPLIEVRGLVLAAGDTVDIVVGNHGSIFNANTPILLDVTVVPEPQTYALLLLGLPVIWRRLRTRTNRAA